MTDEEMADKLAEAWKEATIAWAVCASIHREYAAGRDPLFKTRQSDFQRAEDYARERYANTEDDQNKAQKIDVEKLARAMCAYSGNKWDVYSDVYLDRARGIIAELQRSVE